MIYVLDQYGRPLPVIPRDVNNCLFFIPRAIVGSRVRVYRREQTIYDLLMAGF